MRTKALALACASLMMCTSAFADIIYQNGTFNGTVQGAGISSPQFISDSFTVGAKSNLTSATVGLWTSEGASPVSLTWSIGSTAFGKDIASGTANLSNSLQTDFGDAEVFLSMFNLNATLNAGTYYLTLGNATSTNGTTVGWDINMGPSKAFYMNGPNDTGTADSEYFRLEGTPVRVTPPGRVPEPGSVAILGIGLLGLSAARRRSKDSKS